MANKPLTFAEREAAAGLTGTTTGRDDFYTKRDRQKEAWSSFDSSEMLAGSPMEFKADVTGSAGADGADGLGGSSPLYQDGAYTGPFAIKINGSYSTDGQGEEIQSASFTISVEGGSGTWPTKTQTFSGNGGVSASASDEFYRIYGQITATRTAGSKTIDLWTNPSVEVVTATTGETIGSNTRFKNEGSNTYTFFFLIGTVGITVQPSGGYKIFVNQVQIGNYTYGTAQGSAADTDGNDTRDGLKSLTICINGTPYTADFEITNIVKVTS